MALNRLQLSCPGYILHGCETDIGMINILLSLSIVCVFDVHLNAMQGVGFLR